MISYRFLHNEVGFHGHVSLLFVVQVQAFRDNSTGLYMLSKKTLEIPNDEIIVCGMSVGYIDDDANVNNLETERASVSEFAKFFED